MTFFSFSYLCSSAKIINELRPCIFIELPMHLPFHIKQREGPFCVPWSFHAQNRHTRFKIFKKKAQTELFHLHNWTDAVTCRHQRNNNCFIIFILQAIKWSYKQTTPYKREGVKIIRFSTKMGGYFARRGKNVEKCFDATIAPMWQK